MSLKLKHKSFDKILAKLGEEYSIYAPRRFKDCGRFSDTDLIRYGKISSVDDMVWDEKSNFSPKEIVFPITQSIFSIMFILPKKTTDTSIMINTNRFRFRII